ncbi:MAG: helix-turn-helix transcriptional regulator [Dehalococcoidales bacterium]|nr:helix-turn-helix transcriptional regulator [Dehalococcoidales bacterium]
MATRELDDFLRQQCKERRLSLRGLSIQAGLSPGTLHNIIKRKYQPTIFSLNRLADHLGVKRQYLWHLAGLLDDMDYSRDTQFGDPRLKSIFARVDKLPEAARNLAVTILEALVGHFQGPGTTA